MAVTPWWHRTTHRKTDCFWLRVQGPVVCHGGEGVAVEVTWLMAQTWKLRKRNALDQQVFLLFTILFGLWLCRSHSGLVLPLETLPQRHSKVSSIDE